MRMMQILSSLGIFFFFFPFLGFRKDILKSANYVASLRISVGLIEKFCHLIIYQSVDMITI